ncbi:hypothetical protein WN48_11164 [Eufriesea mexicana]|uniref:Uncharacterized protein n=1 Tax=Eufriesea mexicana TaxID=516756 RepID=A0A310S8I2_9HYME|nr:hypothetical protein WN48_11164 [Eufriesea mexicana]
MNNSNNKETINLLDLLSDSDSDVSDLVLTPKKKKVKRKHRPCGTVKMKQTDSCGCGKSDMRIISLWLAAVLITFWLIALSWLAVILYGEIKKMDTSIKSAVGEGVAKLKDWGQIPSGLEWFSRFTHKESASPLGHRFGSNFAGL